ncbi:hypothetical protein GCK32_009239, partial [Trichostrongylus colubriformis]
MFRRNKTRRNALTLSPRRSSFQIAGSPRDHASLQDGMRFLQYSSPNLHICYSARIVK